MGRVAQQYHIIWIIVVADATNLGFAEVLCYLVGLRQSRLHVPNTLKYTG